MFKYLFLLLLVAVEVFAQNLSVDGGIVYFPGKLSEEIEVAPYGGFEVDFELTEYTEFYLHGALSYLKLKRNNDFKGLFQFIGRAGLETPQSLFKYASAGVGISIAGVRGNSDGEDAEKYMLSSSESEFGWNARLKMNVLKMGNLKFGLLVNYDEIWTLPKNTSILSGGIFCRF